MRIVQVAPFYMPVIGGVEEVVKRIAEHLAAQGHEVYVVTYNKLRKGGAGKLPKEEAINGVRVIRLKPTAISCRHIIYKTIEL
ncbi:MAG: glycosyltransferase [Thermofilaceae archaeon]